MVAHLLWEQGVEGSNPFAPTNIIGTYGILRRKCFFLTTPRSSIMGKVMPGSYGRLSMHFKNDEMVDVIAVKSHKFIA